MQKQLSVTHDRILTILGPLLQIVVWLPGLNMWIRVLLSHMVWPCLYIQPPRINVSHVRSPEGASKAAAAMQGKSPETWLFPLSRSAILQHVVLDLRGYTC